MEKFFLWNFAQKIFLWQTREFWDFTITLSHVSISREIREDRRRILHSRVSRQVNWSGRSLRFFFTNGSFLKSLDAFAEFQRAWTARTITLRLQIRPWFIAPLFAPLIFRKALLVASQRVVTNYSIDAPIFQMRFLRTFFSSSLKNRSRLTSLRSLNTFIIMAAMYKLIGKLKMRMFCGALSFLLYILQISL